MTLSMMRAKKKENTHTKLNRTTELDLHEIIVSNWHVTFFDILFRNGLCQHNIGSPTSNSSEG